MTRTGPIPVAVREPIPDPTRLYTAGVPSSTPTVDSSTSQLALYRRWRAQTFSQIVGQEAVVETLRNAVRLERLRHAFLFVGPRGTGKTSMARILAKAVNCTNLQGGEPCDVCPSCVSIREGRALDVIELDAASNNRVDDMRELLPRVYTGASDLRRKVFIIDEVQRIKEGWDVLLKTLEEPPEGVLFIFCTTDPSQIRPAVVSRLQRFTFRPLSPEQIEGKLMRILAAEGRTAEPDAVSLVAHLAAGGMRDAESMLDQVLVNAADPVTADGIRDLLGLADSDAVDGFVRALAKGDALVGMAVLDDLEAEGRDLVAFAEQVVARVRALLVARLTRPGEGEDGIDAAALAGAARRLTGIDASRSGLGGYRWQLELALLGAATAVDGAPPATSRVPRANGVDSRPGTVRSTQPVAAVPAASVPAAAVPAAAVPATPEPMIAELAPAEPAAVRSALGEPSRTTESPVEPEPARSTPEPSGSRPPGLPEDAIASLRQAWPEVVAYVSRNPANRPIVVACRPVEIRDGLVVLGFPEDQAFLRDVAERKRPALEEGLEHVLGRKVGVRCVVANVELTEPAGVDGDDLVAQARRIFEGDLADVRDIG